MVYIAYFTELILQICDFAQKRRICRENCKYVLDEHFHGHFCPRRKAAKFCHPDADRMHPYLCLLNAAADMATKRAFVLDLPTFQISHSITCTRGVIFIGLVRRSKNSNHIMSLQVMIFYQKYEYPNNEIKT